MSNVFNPQHSERKYFNNFYEKTSGLHEYASIEIRIQDQMASIWHV